MTTPRENILGVFRHETPRWTPICGHCDPWNQPSREDIHAELADATRSVGWAGESTVAFSRYLGLDIMDFVGAPVSVRRSRVSVDSAQDLVRHLRKE